MGLLVSHTTQHKHHLFQSLSLPSNTLAAAINIRPPSPHRRLHKQTNTTILITFSRSIFWYTSRALKPPLTPRNNYHRHYNITFSSFSCWVLKKYIFGVVLKVSGHDFHIVCLDLILNPCPHGLFSLDSN